MQHDSKREVAIVGFADSWNRTPWERPHMDLWGLNSLHKVAQDKPWSAWFQLHDLDTHHGKDDEHLGWLASREIPIYMFPEHAEKYRERIPMVTDYPKDEIVKYFDTDYFTNSISWMIALAIYQSYTHVGVYGVDMAQAAEYREQRPSCEFFLGWAKGAGMEIHIPDDSDLLKTTHMYGLEESRGHIKRLQARMKKVQEQRGSVEAQIQQGQGVLNQLIGQQENMNYVLQTWTASSPDVEEEESS